MSWSNHIYDWTIFGAKCAGALVVFGLYQLYINQDNILYIPNPPGMPKTPDENPKYLRSPLEWTVSGNRATSQTPMMEKLTFLEEFIVTDDNISIHTWIILQKESRKCPTLVYFHGNAGNMGFRLPNAAQMYAKAGINIVMVDYRGYGSSSGTPNEKGLNLDGEAVIKFLSKHPKLNGSKLIMFGRSLGGAVAISLAHKFPELVSGVIVENTFLSIAAMVDTLMPLIAPAKGLILRIGWHSETLIKDLKQPIMFISGLKDELVPPVHMKKLHKLAVRSKYRYWFEVPTGTHNETFIAAGMQYYLRLKEFCLIVDSGVSDNNDGDNNNNNNSGSNDVKYVGRGGEDNGGSSAEIGSIPTMTKNLNVK